MGKKIARFAMLIFLAAGCGTSNQPNKVNQSTLNLNSQATTTQASPALIMVYSIGSVSRHPKNYVEQKIKLAGFLFQKEAGYAIFSDEPSGAVGIYDLPVTGNGINGLKFNQKYFLSGTLIYRGLQASNHNDYHFELLAPPEASAN